MKKKKILTKSLSNRNDKIRILRQSGLTYKEIGKKYKISIERVRQVLTDKFEFCPRHKVSYSKQCLHCMIEDKFIPSLKNPRTLKKEIENSKKIDRNKLEVFKRMAIIIFLKEIKKFNFTEIAFMLERNHTSIINLYNKKLWNIQA